MKPDVNQHLKSMCKALKEIVLPELEGKPFVQEQAGLIAASLELLIDVQDHQFAYVHQELQETRHLVDAYLRAIPADLASRCPLTESRNALATPQDLPTLRDLLTQEKSALRSLMDAYTPLPGSPLAATLADTIERQLARESAWLRKTGFLSNAESIPSIGAVLKQHALTPLRTE